MDQTAPGRVDAIIEKITRESHKLTNDIGTRVNMEVQYRNCLTAKRSG